MASLARAELDSLRAKIAAIEKRPPLAEGVGSGGSVEAGKAAAGEALLAVPAGLLHEVFADSATDSGTALGFALGMASGLMGGARRAVIYLQLVKDMAELGVPYGLGFPAFGYDAHSLVMGRMENLTDMLWALEEAIACRAVAAVVAEMPGRAKALDFTASRRLSLRAAAMGTSVLLLRYATAREASAAKLRWRVRPATSGPPVFDARSPGRPRFVIDVEKYRLDGKAPHAEGQKLIVDWTENGFASVDRGRTGRVPVHRTTPLPRIASAPLGDRLSQTG